VFWGVGIETLEMRFVMSLGGFVHLMGIGYSRVEGRGWRRFWMAGMYYGVAWMVKLEMGGWYSGLGRTHLCVGGFQFTARSGFFHPGKKGRVLSRPSCFRLNVWSRNRTF
jgi:hypothetical protein